MPSATRARELLAAMSLGDKIQMVTGSYSGPNASSSPNNEGSVGTIEPNPKLCIPLLALNDSVNGMGDAQTGTTAFPDSIGLAAGWDPTLAQKYGQVLGEEAWKKGINIVLGPGTDIARNPLNGRNFEYVGEDPYLAGRAVAAVIRGIQSRHVVATVKHYALNDQESNRTTDSSDVSVRTMEEIGLPAFDAAVQAGVGSAMCSYNRINSVYACQNPYLLRQVLDRQFRFSGWVMSDWSATHSTVPSANSGLDMEMPTGSYFGSHLQAAVEAGQVRMSTLNEMVYRVLYPVFRLGLFDNIPPEGAQAASTQATTAQSLSAATQVAESGSVLLKDAHGVLPLGGSGKRIAVIGPAAGPNGAQVSFQGGGSGHVPIFGPRADLVSPLQAMQTRAARAGDVVTYADGTSTADAVATASAADVAVVVISDGETEGSDRPDMNARIGECFTSCAYWPIDQNALVSAVAGANRHTIVVVQSGGPVSMPWIAKVQGVLENWFPGQVDGNSIAPILFGDVNPSGKLPVTFPVKFTDGPLRTQAQYPGVTKPGDSVGPHSSYSEGLLVGYRWYDARRIAPLFPFGYGLSYTSFGFSSLSVRSRRSGAQVVFTVTNTGHRAGADVAQVYVGMPTATGEPPRQLKGFQKVWLAPGQSRQVRMWLPQVSFAHWSSSAHTWTVSPGRYLIYAGDSSAALPLHASIHRSRARLAPSVY